MVHSYSYSYQIIPSLPFFLYVYLWSNCGFSGQKWRSSRNIRDRSSTVLILPTSTHWKLSGNLPLEVSFTLHFSFSFVQFLSFHVLPTRSSKYSMNRAIRDSLIILLLLVFFYNNVISFHPLFSHYFRFTDAEYPTTHVSHEWKKLGFQSDDPQRDFRATGIFGTCFPP